jgi:hypothetical protein
MYNVRLTLHVELLEQADYLCSEAPSFTEYYEYAHEHGIKWLVIITESALSLAGTVKVQFGFLYSTQSSLTGDSENLCQNLLCMIDGNM